MLSSDTHSADSAFIIHNSAPTAAQVNHIHPYVHYCRSHCYHNKRHQTSAQVNLKITLQEITADTNMYYYQEGASAKHK